MTGFQQDIFKIVLDRLLIGLLLAMFGFLLSRLLEKHRANVAYRQGLMVQRLEACRTVVTMFAEFHQRYMSWIDELEVLLRKLEADTASSSDIATTLLRWNEVSSVISSATAALIPMLPVPIAVAVGEYLVVANKFPRRLRAGAQADVEGVSFGKPIREELLNSFAKLQATYAHALAEGSLANLT